MSLNRSKLKAFSVAEAILSLFITICCVEILMGLVGILKTANAAKEPVNEVAFAYVQLEKFLKDEGHVETNIDASNSKKVVLNKKIGEKNNKPVFKTYVLSQYKNMIRMAVVEGGHMPLLFDVRIARFSSHEDYFDISITENDGRKSKLRFKTDKPIKIEETKKEKQKNEKKEHDKSNKDSKKEKDK